MDNLSTLLPTRTYSSTDLTHKYMTYDVLPATDEVRAMVANRKRNRAHNPTKVSS